MRYIAIALMALAVQTAPPSGFRAEVETMRKKREVEILGPNGWASLVGLHFMTTGSHTVGRDRANDVVLLAPSAPPVLGTLVARADGATLTIAPGIVARVKNQPVKVVEMKPGTLPADGVTVGGMTMVLIKRGGKLALRVWDRESPMLKAILGLQWYPIDPAWRLDATFTRHQPVPRMKILNVLGETIEMANPGVVTFRVGGRDYQLEALLESDEANELFFMFTDGTSGTTTYKASRYLYTSRPVNGRLILDFNEAKNPPCAFTDFATCPLPPAANRLSLSIPAGELNDGHK
jgi:hypothetical protein